MTTSEQRNQMRKAFGHPFTSKKKVMEAMGYKRHTEVNPYFLDLPKAGSRFFTDDVIERILNSIEYES